MDRNLVILNYFFSIYKIFNDILNLLNFNKLFSTIDFYTKDCHDELTIKLTL